MCFLLYHYNHKFNDTFTSLSVKKLRPQFESLSNMCKAEWLAIRNKKWTRDKAQAPNCWFFPAPLLPEKQWPSVVPARSPWWCTWHSLLEGSNWVEIGLMHFAKTEFPCSPEPWERATVFFHWGTKVPWGCTCPEGYFIFASHKGSSCPNVCVEFSLLLSLPI